MKRLMILAVLGLVMTSFRFQNNTDSIVSALKSGNAQQIGQYFDEFLDMKLLERAEVKNLSKNQATIALQQFLSENGVNGFEKLSERELGNTMYITGKLQNASKGYNITVLMRTRDGKRQIISLRIS